MENQRSVAREDGQMKNRKQSAKAANSFLYKVVSLLVNSLLGFMGLGVGFIFFLGTAVAGGSTGLMVLVFGGGAVVIGIYIYIIVVINRFLVARCASQSKRIDRQRMIFSMIYVIIFLLVTFIYSFLQAGVILHSLK